MSRRRPRTITIHVTGAQFDALAGAVAERSMTLEDQITDEVPGARVEHAVLDRAWTTIKRAWYSPYRGRL